MSPTNPFDEGAGPGRVNPFGDERAGEELDPLPTIQEAARRVRMLRARMGADGLTPSASRELVEHLAKALDATATAIARLQKP
jgi:hypothetical protein